jgi:hypothetical protein
MLATIALGVVSQRHLSAPDSSTLQLSSINAITRLPACAIPAALSAGTVVVAAAPKTLQTVSVIELGHRVITHYNHIRFTSLDVTPQACEAGFENWRPWRQRYNDRELLLGLDDPSPFSNSFDLQQAVSAAQ